MSESSKPAPNEPTSSSDPSHDAKAKPGQNVTITINGLSYPVRPGNHAVAELKTLPSPHIPQEDTLCKMINAVATPVTQSHIDIEGGEIFASNCPSGGAS